MDDIEIEGRNYDLITIKQFQLQIEHNVKDPRSQSKITYALHTLLTIFVLAKMAGATDCQRIYTFWNLNVRKLQSLIYGLGEEVPTPQTIKRCVTILEEHNLINFFTKIFLDFYAKGACQYNKGETPALEKRDVIGANGQNIRATNGKYITENWKIRTKTGYDIVSLFSTQYGLTLCQQVVDKKNQEAKAIGEMLEIINVRNSILAWDALNTRPKLLDQVVKCGADFLVVIKGNNGNSEEEIEDCFYFLDAHPKYPFNDEKISATRHDAGHGRVETRTIEALPVECMSKTFRKTWPHVNSVIRVVTNRCEKREGKCSEETQSVNYYISSLIIDHDDERYAEKLQNIILSRWKIESTLHYQIDMFFDQDRIPLRNQDYIKNSTCLTKISHNILSYIRKQILEQTKRAPSIPTLQTLCNDVEIGFAFMSAYVYDDLEHLKDIEILYNMFFKRLEVVEERQVEIVVKEEPIEFELQKYIKKRKAKPKKE